MLLSTIRPPVPFAVADHLPLILLVVAVLVVLFRRYQRRDKQDHVTQTDDPRHRDEEDE